MEEKLKCVEFIKKNGLDSLKEKGINITRHKRFKNLIQLSYSKIQSNFDDEIVNECRGLILDEKNGQYNFFFFMFKTYLFYPKRIQGHLFSIVNLQKNFYSKPKKKKQKIFQFERKRLFRIRLG